MYFIRFYSLGTISKIARAIKDLILSKMWIFSDIEISGKKSLHTSMLKECLLPKNLTKSSCEKVIHTYVCAFSGKLI